MTLYFSSKLDKAQSKYSATELETFAFVAATRKWRKYLEAAPKVIALSDHNPLQWLRKQSDPRGKFARWLIELEVINYEIKYRRGKDNVVADYLSRAPTATDDIVNDEFEFLERHVYSIDDTIEEAETEAHRMIIAQNEDSEIATVKKQLEGKDSKDKEWRSERNQYRLFRGLLFRGKRMVVPSSMCETIIAECHTLAHAGIKRNVAEIAARFYWKNMWESVRRYINQCTVCQHNKRKYNRREPMQFMKIPFHEPRAVIAMDVATLPWSEDGYRYILVIVDLFSKHIEIGAMKDMLAQTIKETLEQTWVNKHGLPQILLSDQGRNVDGTIIRVMCEQLGIEKRHSSAYHPEGDGQAERSVQTVKQTMRCLLEDRVISHTNWPSIVSEVTFVCNALVNTSTGFSPHQIMYGTKLRTKLDRWIPRCEEENRDVRDYSRTNIEERKSLWKEADSSQVKMKQWYDRGKTPSKIHSGDEVFVDIKPRKHALAPIFDGPWLVEERKDVNLHLINVNTGKRQVVHINRCKKRDMSYPVGTHYPMRVNHELSDTDSINDSNSETEGLRSDSDEEHSNSEISERAVPALVPRRSTRVNKGKLPERYSDNLYDFPKEPLEPGSSFRKGEEMS